MTELAAHIVDSVIPDVPVRQFVLTLPPHLRSILAWNAELRGKVLSAFMRALEKHYVQQALAAGAVEPKFAAISVLQRWDGAIRVFPHWHVVAVDGVWHKTATGLKFLRADPMRTEQVAALLADIIKRVTLQAERFFARRADADGALKPGDPALPSCSTCTWLCRQRSTWPCRRQWAWPRARRAATATRFGRWARRVWFRPT